MILSHPHLTLTLDLRDWRTDHLQQASDPCPLTPAFCSSRIIPRMIAKDLLEMLVCPADKQPLEYRQNPESLKCTACHRVYPVKDDIPIMLIDEAKVEP
jgi:uncharacterized protein